MKQTLQSLSGLIDFECAARWSSFKLAAQELHKTPAAVSQQIRQLEQALGFALFTRHARHLTVTEKGRELAETVTRQLRELNVKIAALKEGDEESVLRVSATHSFAMKWLIPRLHRFTENHPELDIRIESSDQVVNLDASDCDVALRYGRIGHAQENTLLFCESLVVVYSPGLLRTVGQATATDLAKLSRYPLLFEGTPEHWLRLLKENRINQPHYDFSRSYSHAGLLVQAAVAGHGVALAPYSIACEDILKGGLRICSCRIAPPEYGYRLLYSRQKAEMAKIRLFQEWITAEANATINSFRSTQGEN